MDLRVRALESVLVDKGYVDPAALDELIDTYETHIGPRNGARVVARAWVDASYRDWLLSDATAAIASLGYTGRQSERMMAVENTPQRHNLVVCTLCSCYPWAVLGLPPAWYKSAPYRSRAVRDPRGVLAEFGVTLPPDMQEMLKAQRTTLNAAERQQLFDKIAAEEATDLPIVYLYNRYWLWAYNKKLTGVRQVPDALLRVQGLKME